MARRSGRAARLLLVATTALTTVLGLQLACSPAASAAGTRPTAVDDRAIITTDTSDVVLPGSRDDLPGSSPVQPSLTAFPTNQLGSLPAGSSVVSYRIVDPTFGTWSLNDATGEITFHAIGVTGTRTVRYTVTNGDQLTDEGTATVTVSATSGAELDEIDTVQGAPATLDVLANDRAGWNADGSRGTIDRSTLRWQQTQSAPVIVSRDGLVVTDPGVGVFTIDPATALVTFAPEAGYVTQAQSDAIAYTVQDTTRLADGTVRRHELSSSVFWRVTAAARLVLSEKASPELFSHVGDAITFTATVTNGGTSPLSGLTLRHSLGSRLSADACTPVAIGGALAPAASTTCTVTTRARQTDVDAVEARLSDVVAATATATVGGSTLKAYAQNGASSATRVTQGLTIRATTSPTSVSAVGQRVGYTFVVRNKGNRSVKDLVVSSSSPGVSALVCAPVALGGRLGDNQTTTCTATRTVTAADLRTPALTATAKATAVPVSGSHLTAANAAVTVRTAVPSPSSGPVAPVPPSSGPTALPDTASTRPAQPVVIDVLANDRPGSPDVPLVGSSVRLRTPLDVLPPGTVLYGDGKTLKLPGWGVFLVSGTGQITFVPLGPQTGLVPTVGYQVSDANGAFDRSLLDVRAE